jgi:lipoate-protein ligase A
VRTLITQQTLYSSVSQSHSGDNMAEAFADMLEEFGIDHKLLSVTCDNASNNDTMIESLEQRIEGWAGRASRTRCFAHVVNLVAKSLLKLFDTSTKKSQKATEEVEEAVAGIGAELEMDENDEALEKLVEGIDLEEMISQLQQADGTEGDNTDGLVDEVESLSVEDREELERSIKPVKVVLVKVRKIITHNLLYN